MNNDSNKRSYNNKTKSVVNEHSCNRHMLHEHQRSSFYQKRDMLSNSSMNHHPHFFKQDNKYNHKDRFSTLSSSKNCATHSSPSLPTKTAVLDAYPQTKPLLWTKTKPMIGKPKDDRHYYYSSSVECSPLNQKSYTNPTVKLIEIMPGVTERLRDTDETWNAIQNDFYSPVTCFACSGDLLCISDAQYVICPDCRVVSPMEEPAADHGSFVDGAASGGGVGLGFTVDSLFRWQEEIIRDHEAEKRQQSYQNGNETCYF